MKMRMRTGGLPILGQLHHDFLLKQAMVTSERYGWSYDFFFLPDGLKTVPGHLPRNSEII